MLRSKTLSRLIPAPVNDFMTDVCNKRKIHNASFLPMILVPIDSGNGRSTIIKAVTNLFRETEAIFFSSHTNRYLEFKPNGTVDAIHRMDMEIQDNKAATYTNEFQGIVGIDMDSMMTHLNDAVGEKFFELAERIKKKALLIIFVPGDAHARQIETITNKLGIGTKLFDPIIYDAEYLSQIFYDKSSKYSNQSIRYDDCKERIADYIENNIREKTLKNVLKSADALLYNDEALRGIYGIPEKRKVL